MTTGDYLALWLEAYVFPFRRPSTVACYRRAIGSLPDTLRSMPLEQVTGLHLQAAINAQAVRHPRAAQLTYTMLHVAFGRARLLHMIPFNPADGCIKPLHKPRKAAILTADQLRKYLDAARGGDCYPLLLLAATLGLRRGEAMGLTWAAVDFAQGTVAVTQQRIYSPGHGYVIAPLKTHSSNRVLPLPAAVADELIQWRRGQRVLSAFVVDCTTNALYKAHRAALAAAQLPPCTLHGLRHSFATMAAGSGTTIKVLQVLLGHSTYKLTADLYADHLRSDLFGADVARVAGLCGLV